MPPRPASPWPSSGEVVHVLVLLEEEVVPAPVLLAEEVIPVLVLLLEAVVSCFPLPLSPLGYSSSWISPTAPCAGLPSTVAAAAALEVLEHHRQSSVLALRWSYLSLLVSPDWLAW
ncbi:hypothetical protein PF008_g5513 [Phytophthora fragariae]|uniref:Uncharacterized protein n=1 Tax=Phytophthora fragariae TaxID=53985 RepID=A0A6G0S848_9STRA|nr:hypothetical protein PF008_g5513 [Phytophthora fragariae]